MRTTIEEDISKLLIWFSSCVENRKHGCSEIFCGTCGGLYREIDSLMTHDKRVLLASILQRATIDQLKLFGSYKEIARRLDPYRYRMPFIRAITAVDKSNPREIDDCLMAVRRNLSICVEPFSDLIEDAVQIALNDRDISLTETLIIVLGSQSLDYPDLVNFAKQVAIDNHQMKRVLYNTLRYDLPEVRDFVGDGTTYVPYYFRYY